MSSVTAAQNITGKIVKYFDTIIQPSDFNLRHIERAHRCNIEILVINGTSTGDDG